MKNRMELLAAATVAALGWPLLAAAQPVSSVCTIRSMVEETYAPLIRPFPIITHDEQIPVAIDPSTGAIGFDFGALPVFEFPNNFSSQSGLDTVDFQDGVVTGTIDSGGNVVLPGIRGINCTQGKCPNGGPPCPCIPGNLCSNDVTRVCVDGGTGDLSCPPVPPSEEEGVCQGVCSNDRTQTCATSADCTLPGFCGEGVGMRLGANLTTGTVTFEGFTDTGSATGVFVDGSIRLVDVYSTPPETYGIGDTGVTGLVLDCQLSPVPDEGTLPPPPAWTVKKGTVKLGKGEPGTGDDKLSLKGSFLPIAGIADFASEDLVVTLRSGDVAVTSFRIPAGSLHANKKGTKFKLVDKDGTLVEVAPPAPLGSSPSHKISIKRGKDGQHALVLGSKGLNLDGLDVGEITSGIIFGFQTPSTTSAVTAKGSKRTF